jgi:hypothetical protein
MRPTTLHINEFWSTRKVDIHMRPTTLHINEFWCTCKVDIHMRPTTLHINEFWFTCKVYTYATHHFTYQWVLVYTSLCMFYLAIKINLSLRFRTWCMAFIKEVMTSITYFFLGQVQFTTYFVIYIIIICNSAQERKKKCQHCSHSPPLSFIDFLRIKQKFIRIAYLYSKCTDCRIKMNI